MGSSDLWGSPRKPEQVSDLSFVPSKNKRIEKEIIAWTQIKVVGLCLFVINSGQMDLCDWIQWSSVPYCSTGPVSTRPRFIRLPEISDCLVVQNKEVSISSWIV